MESERGVLALTLECVWVSAVLPKGSLGSWEEVCNPGVGEGCLSSGQLLCQRGAWPARTAIAVVFCDLGDLTLAEL